MAEAFLEKRLPPLRVLAKQKDNDKDHLQRKLRASLMAYHKQEANNWKEQLPKGALIAVADAIWYMLSDRKHAIYVILLRSVKDDIATVTPPILIEGHEDMAGWMRAFKNLPLELQKRIQAVVCDGGVGIVGTVRAHGWILQRCHFHLLAAVQNYLTSGPRSARREYALFVLRHIQKFLVGKHLKAEADILQEVAHTSKSHGLRRVLGGLLRDRADYHAYLHYPELRLPTTSNSAESAIRSIRDLMSRCRGFRSREATELWLTAWAVHKKTIHCRPKNQPN